MSRQAHILNFDAVRARNASLGSGRVSARGRAREAAAARAARRREQTGFGWAALRRDPASAWEQAGYGYDSYNPDSADDWREEEDEPVVETGRNARRSTRSKKRAERAYSRAIDNSAPADDDGPRAAFYKMKMGKGHRRAASQAGNATRASRKGFGVGVPGLSALSGVVAHLPKSLALKVAGGVIVCLVAMALFLYPAAQNYYIAKRDLAKTEVAYQVVQERNALLEKDVAALQTKEGIEDRVREEYGWVKPGENAVVVTGREGSGKEFHADDLPTVDAAEAPRTWYSDVLDPFFGYQG